MVRVNTTGHANLVYGRNVIPELSGLIDAISISLNAADARSYVKLCALFPGQGIPSCADFIRECKKYIPDVTLTCVELPNIDITKCKDIARKLKVKFRLRPYLNQRVISDEF